MKQKNKVLLKVPKNLLFLFIITALLISSSPSMAAGGGGAIPSQAVILTADEINIASLKPGEQHWFKFQASAEKSLTLTFTPGDDRTIKFVALKIFKADQIALFNQGNAEKMVSFGATKIVFKDNNPETGQIFWQEQLNSSQTYYILVSNDSDFSVDYELANNDITDTAVVDEPAIVVTEEVVVTQKDTPAMSNSPYNAEPLPSGMFKGTVAPHSTYWHSFQYPDFSGNSSVRTQDFTMFFTPDNGNRRHHVNFELFPYSQLQIWQRGDTNRLTNFGAGMLVSRDRDHNTGERVWRGQVVSGDKYLMAVENGSDVPINYWIFEGNIYNPILGPQPEPAKPIVFAPGASPQTAEPLKIGVNKGALEPGEEVWYSFNIASYDSTPMHEMALTMIVTPDDGNLIRKIPFDVFTYDGARDWSPGDNSQINNMGTGSYVERDKNPLTGERFWSGWVIDNNTYFVQIHNGNEIRMDYYLFTGDVYRPELGKPSKPTPRPSAAPGKAPYSSIPLEVGINKGQLQPYEEQWYVFSRGDVNQTGSVETVFTLVFTPDDGNLVRDINLELFEGNQLRDWSPDNRFNIISFGKGSVVNRDGDLNTGELLWNGHVIANNLYYMRVSNETKNIVDYWVFPKDVINTSLARQ